MGLKELKAAIERYEKATDWIDKASPEDVEKHYQRYLQVVEEARKVMDEYTKTLGYGPFKNYAELLERSAHC